jgi:hypothetical protein
MICTYQPTYLPTYLSISVMQQVLRMVAGSNGAGTMRTICTHHFIAVGVNTGGIHVHVLCVL